MLCWVKTVEPDITFNIKILKNIKKYKKIFCWVKTVEPDITFNINRDLVPA